MWQSPLFFLLVLGERPHFIDQSAFYSSKLKTEPVKIAFLVDNARGYKARRNEMLFNPRCRK
jgi:hypothetical protein